MFFSGIQEENLFFVAVATISVERIGHFGQHGNRIGQHIAIVVMILFKFTLSSKTSVSISRLSSFLLILWGLSELQWFSGIYKLETNKQNQGLVGVSLYFLPISLLVRGVCLIQVTLQALEAFSGQFHLQLQRSGSRVSVLCSQNLLPLQVGAAPNVAFSKEITLSALMKMTVFPMLNFVMLA